jgi:hypothetical protein
MAEIEDLSDISIDPNLEWELEQGIPQFEDPFIEKYMQGREALIEQEKKQRHGESCSFRFSPSPAYLTRNPFPIFSFSHGQQTHCSNPLSAPYLLVLPKPSLESARKNWPQHGPQP